MVHIKRRILNNKRICKSLRKACMPKWVFCNLPLNYLLIPIFTLWEESSCHGCQHLLRLCGLEMGPSQNVAALRIFCLWRKNQLCQLLSPNCTFPWVPYLLPAVHPVFSHLWCQQNCFLLSPEELSSATRTAAYKSRELTPLEATLHSLGKEGSHQLNGPASQNSFRGHSVTHGHELVHTLLNNTPASSPLLPTSSPWEYFQINCLHPNPCLGFCFWKC